MVSKNRSKSKRLEALRILLAEVSCGIRNAQQGLLEHEESSNNIYLVADVLGRLGWLVERGCVVAGYESPPVVGSADAWMLSPYLREHLERYERVR